MPQRQYELDFLKCVMIVLMVTFHLTYIEDLYPYSKQIVFTFHMPVFLIISGYFSPFEKTVSKLKHSVWRMAWPYLLAETMYVVMSSVMPVRDGVDHLTPSVLIDKLLLHPMGPYWYLHSVVLCAITTFVALRLVRYVQRFVSFSESTVTFVLLTALAALSWPLSIVSLTGVFYFGLGLTLKRCRLELTQVFRPSWWSLLPLSVLCSFSSNLNAFSLTGVLIVYLVVSFLLSVYRSMSSHLSSLLFVGRNTLPVLLFSPIFTMAAKKVQFLFAFDATGLLFAVVATGVGVMGSLAVAWTIDKLRLSRLVFGSSQVLMH